jgi:Tol biopolymer transport system component
MRTNLDPIPSMHRLPGRLRTPALGMTLGVLLGGLSSCGAGEDLTAPQEGSIEIVTATSGSPPDPDGYQVSVDSGSSQPLTLADTLSQPGLSLGRHSVEITGIAAHCSVQGANPRAVDVVAGKATRVTFGVTCQTPPELGSLEATVMTSGFDIDPDGYEVAVDPSAVQPAPLDGTVTFEGIPAGMRTVRLTGVAGNCTVPGNPVVVSITPDQTTAVAFRVACWPPRSGRIAFSRDGDMYTIGADGTELRQLTGTFDPGVDEYPDWSPDGTKIAFARDEAIHVMNADGTDPARLTPDTLGDFQRWPRWSPDGRQLLFIYSWDPEGGGDLYRIGSDGTGLRQIHDNVLSASWSPDGRRIAVALAKFVPRSSTCCLESGLYLLDPEGANETTVIPAERGPGTLTVDWSPDGSRIALEAFGDLYLTDTLGSLFLLRPDRIEELATGSSVAWSPDGLRLAFTRSPYDGNTVFPNQIYIVNLDGGGEVQLTDTSRESFSGDSDPAWTP